MTALAGVFEMLPNVVAQLVGAHIMTILSVLCVTLPGAWIVVFITYERHRKAKGDQDRAKPGAFPGDNR